MHINIINSILKKEIYLNNWFKKSSRYMMSMVWYFMFVDDSFYNFLQKRTKKWELSNNFI